MRIQYNAALGRHTAADEYGVVLAIYYPEVHGSIEDFTAHARSLVTEG